MSPQLVLAELPSGVTQRLKCGGDRRVFVLEAQVGAGHGDLRQSRPVRVLPADEGRSTSRATLLTVVAGETDPFGRDPVDVRRSIAHKAVALAAEVRDADVITPDDQDVQASIGHGVPPQFLVDP